MSKLIEVYANACGLKIKNPYLREAYFPLQDEKYITIQNSSGQQAKNYDYWNDVIDLIYPYLEEKHITLVQLGSKDNQPVKRAKYLIGQTSISQAAYILKHSLLHIGTDSWMAHFAGQNNIPLVAVYGTTSIKNHGPYWFDGNKTILLESHRNGNLPTYGNDPIKTVNFIKPETIVSAVYKLLNVEYKTPIETVFIGQYYNQSIMEWIPDGVVNPQFFPQLPLTTRLDLHFNEQNIAIAAINSRKLNIVTDKPIDLNIVNRIKQNILGITYEINESDSIDYIDQLKKTGVKMRIFTKESDAEKISNLRLKFFNVCFIEYMADRTKQNFLDDAAKYLNSPLDKVENFDTMFYRSNKFVIANDKIFISKADWAAGKNISSFEVNNSQVIDNDEFWKEYQHFNIFKKI
jgi:hypothetical protein